MMNPMLPFPHIQKKGGAAAVGNGVTVLLTGSGNFASPTANTPMLVECWAQGGTGVSDGGAGGGCGAYAASMVLSTGGNMAYDCDDNGDCNFASTVIAQGASGATGGLASGSTGDVTRDGADGGTGDGANGYGGGGAGVGNLSAAGEAGGNSDPGISAGTGAGGVFPGVGTYFGSGGEGGAAGTPGTAGANATGYGHGGGGGGGQSDGGAHAPGVIRITWLTSTSP